MSKKLKGKATTQMAPPVDIERILTKIKAQYTELEHIIDAAFAGEHRAVFVNGPPGFGKSYMVTQAANKARANPKRNGNKIFQMKVAHGNMSPLALYKTLFDLKEKGDVLLLDDCDSVYKDQIGCNLLKAAMDDQSGGKIRRLSWDSTGTRLAHLQLPPSFETDGIIIIVSNVGFSKSTLRLQQNADAIQSRTRNIVIGDWAPENYSALMYYIIMICDVLKYDANAKKTDFTQTEKFDIYKFISDNIYKWNRVDFRLPHKVAIEYKLRPTAWKKALTVTNFHV
tara:strand:- start:251 stop:1099 length:849 start_codon:yes stop_codon:yes gene_type:complete